MNQKNNPDFASAPIVGITYDRAMDSTLEQSHMHERAQLLYCQAGCYQAEVDKRFFLTPPHSRPMDSSTHPASRLFYQAGSVSKPVHRPTTFQIHS